MQHENYCGRVSAPDMSPFGIYDTSGASMLDVGASEAYGGGEPNYQDAGAFEGCPYNLRTQIAPPNKYTLSYYLKKAAAK
ncbi:hypothetical protein AHAS_Ahas15G0073300 [Arachis hypogaea]